MAMLLGPGSNNETGATIGSFVMSGTGENSGQQEHVNRTGFGVSVDQAGSLSGVFQVPEAQLQHLTTALVPAQGQGPGVAGGENGPNAPQSGGALNQGTSGAQPPAGPGTAPVRPPLFGGGNVGQVSGEQTFAGFQATNQVNLFGALQNGLNQDSTIAAQNARIQGAVQNQTTLGPLTKFSEMDLATRSTGSDIYHFSGSGILSGTNNTFSFLIDINFPNPGDPERSIGGGNSRVDVNLNGTSLTYLLVKDTWVPDENPFQYNGVDPSGTANDNFVAKITVAIENAVVPNRDPIHDIAAQANVMVNITNTTPDPDVAVASGSAVSDARDSGATT
jgi:hypothetical protein